jgi:hypothetical protein
MKKIISFSFSIVVLSIPMVALAAPRNLKDVIQIFIDYLGYAIPLIFSLAIVAFLWGIAQYFFSMGEKKEEARQLALWGIIALFVMISMWGLVRILSGTFQLETSVPQIRSGGGGGNWSIFGTGNGGNGGLTPPGNIQGGNTNSGIQGGNTGSGIQGGNTSGGVQGGNTIFGGERVNGLDGSLEPDGMQ